MQLSGSMPFLNIGLILLLTFFIGCKGQDRHRRSVDVDRGGKIDPEASDHEDIGSTYIRWGRTTCPGHSELVYHGVVGGSFYTHAGGGANYLCLSSDPLWGDYNDAMASHSPIYGAEYETAWPLHNENIEGNTHADNDVPCALCRTTGRSSHLMIPGRNECKGEGWHLEYHGYLMSSHHKHKRTEYVCMDLAPEADPAGYENKNGALFYYVEAACGSLPCPPYINGREITCVVCSK